MRTSICLAAITLITSLAVRGADAQVPGPATRPMMTAKLSIRKESGGAFRDRRSHNVRGRAG